MHFKHNSKKFCDRRRNMDQLVHTIDKEAIETVGFNWRTCSEEDEKTVLLAEKVIIKDSLGISSTEHLEKGHRALLCRIVRTILRRFQEKRKNLVKWVKVDYRRHENLLCRRQKFYFSDWLRKLKHRSVMCISIERGLCGEINRRFFKIFVFPFHALPIRPPP